MIAGMGAPPDSLSPRVAKDADAAVVARLLDDFNTEFEAEAPGVEWLTARVRELIREREIVVLLKGEPPVGLAVLRFNRALWDDGLDAHLDELYVAPASRGRGLGRALLEAALATARRAGASRIDLGTSTDDTAALSLYESAGFTNREGSKAAPSMLHYEREL